MKRLLLCILSSYLTVCATNSLPLHGNTKVNHTQSDELLDHQVKRLVERNLAYAHTAINEKQWRRALSHLNQIENTHRAKELDAGTLHQTYYFKTVALEALEDFEKANKAITKYYQYVTSPEDASWVWEHKMVYASYFARGGRVHFLGFSFAPKIFRDYDLAFDIFDSIMSSATDRAILRRASLEKALLFRTLRQYNLCSAELNEIIMMDPYSAEGFTAFQELGKTYALEMQGRSCHEELITYAAINRNRFVDHYPQADISQVDAWIEQMNEDMAGALLDIAQLYLRRGNPSACRLYQEKAKTHYAQTKRVQKLFPALASHD